MMTVQRNVKCRHRTSNVGGARARRHDEHQISIEFGFCRIRVIEVWGAGEGTKGQRRGGGRAEQGKVATTSTIEAAAAAAHFVMLLGMVTLLLLVFTQNVSLM